MKWEDIAGHCWCTSYHYLEFSISRRGCCCKKFFWFLLQIKRRLMLVLLTIQSKCSQFLFPFSEKCWCKQRQWRHNEASILNFRSFYRVDERRNLKDNKTTVYGCMGPSMAFRVNPIFFTQTTSSATPIHDFLCLYNIHPLLI